MIKRVLAALLRPLVIQLGGLLLASAVIFYGGRALRSVLGLGDGALLALVGVVWLLAAAVFVLRRVQAQKRARLIEDRLRGQAREQKAAARPDRRPQIEALEHQLEEALGALKSSKMGNAALYALPWYVIIGPPGSGKTTLLRESGLSFPQLTHGRGVRGVGGTRNCDWWFTDAGILLDTAGRYTTQSEDREEWLSFLEMLKKARSKKPINGALIAISIADVLQATDEQLVEHTRRVRERLAELTERLELVFPVYLLFTKCDLLDGFVEMFGTYAKKERTQVWGFTLPYLQTQGDALVQRFDAEFDALYQRLGAERLHQLTTTKSQDKKRKVFSFPLQFLLARDRLREFVTQLAQPNPYHESSDIRGFYFTSGTQEGKPLDQILRTMRLASGLANESASAPPEATEKKAYFIDELFTQVVFPDQDLARSSAAAERRRRLVQRVATIATVAATFVVTVLLVVAYAGHANLIDRTIRVCREGAAFDPKQPDHLAREEAAEATGTGPFEELRRLYVELEGRYGGVGTYLLGQVNQLHDQKVRPLYVQKLRAALVEPLQLRLRDSLAAAVAAQGRDRDVRQIADELSGYRMLGGELLLNREWLRDDFLKRQGNWTWRPGQEVTACRPHRQTFVDLVAGTTFRDWQWLPEEGLIPTVNDLVRGKDLFGRELQGVLEEQGQAKVVSWAEILKTHPQAKLLDDSIGVIAAWANEAPLDEILEQKGELLGSNSGDALKARRKQEAIADWKSKLGAMRPQRKPNLDDAMRDVALLTDTDSLYLSAYKEVCGRLQTLGVECRVGDIAWLQETLKVVHDLEPVVQAFLQSRRFGDRMVPAAKGRGDGRFDQLREALRKARKTIRQKTEESADPNVREAMQRALMGVMDCLQYAMAREITEETNALWERELGKQLAEFSRQFPFRPQGTEAVDPGRFDTTFGKGGQFDAAQDWIGYLEQTLAEIGFGEIEPRFAEDRVFVGRLQSALFLAKPGESTAQVEFLLQKRGNMTSVRLDLGTTKTEARATENPTLEWRPAQGAAIAIREFQAFDGKVDAKIEHGGSWGLVRLLGEATPSTANVRGKDYVVYRWSTFLHPKTNQPLVIDGTRAEAALLLRTAAEPNPLAPGFFHREFAREVFRAVNR